MQIKEKGGRKTDQEEERLKLKKEKLEELLDQLQKRESELDVKISVLEKKGDKRRKILNDQKGADR